MSTSAKLTLDPARHLMFSPAWKGERVVFDARSGDFWIVSEAVHEILGMAASGAIPDAVEGKGINAETLASLSKHGIIRSSGRT